MSSAQVAAAIAALEERYKRAARNGVRSFNVADITPEERVRYGFSPDGQLRPPAERRRGNGR
jgi:hypothetical protein